MTETLVPPAGDPTRCGCQEDRNLSMTRRALFRMAGAAGLITATTAGQARVAFGAPAGGDVIVVLSLRGGFDGMSAVVPVGDPAYAKNRPTIAVPASVTKKVDSVFGLHPALKPLYPLWDSGKLAAVHAVGQARPTRSHFAAMEEMERAAPGSSLRTGWIDRAVGTVDGAGLFGATQVGSPGLPVSLAGPGAEFSMRALADVRLSVDQDVVPLSSWREAVSDLHRGARPEVSRPLSAALDAIGTLGKVAAAQSTSTQVGYPAGVIGEALHDIADLVKSDLGVRVATVDFGDLDMHAGLGKHNKGWMYDKLTELAQALAAFAKDLGPNLNRVTLVTLSEFGRRLEENGSGGLDHGNGNAVLVLGGGVNGGKVYGRWPGLAPDELLDGDLAGTTDYRSVIAEILSKRSGIGATSEVFPGLKPSTLGLVKAR